MKRLRSALQRLVKLRGSYSDAAENQLARRLLIANLGWLLLLLLAAPVVISWSLEFDRLDIGTAFLPFSIGISLATHHLIQSGQLQRARQLFVVNILATTLVAFFPEYRIDNPFILVVSIPLTAAGVLLPRSGLVGIGLILIIVFTMGGLIQISSDMKATPLGTDEDSISTTILLVIGVVSLNVVMLLSFSASIDRILQQQRYLGTLITSQSQMSQSLITLPFNAEDMNRSIELLRDKLELYHAQVFLTDPVSGLAVLQASTGYLGRRMLEESSLSSPDEHSPINTALRRKDPLLILDDSPEQERAGFLPATRSELLVPLRIGNLLPIGVLDLHSSERGTFSAERLEMLTAVSHHLATAIYATQQSRELRTNDAEREQLVAQIESSQRELARLNRQLVSTAWGGYFEEQKGRVPGFDWNKGAVQPAQSGSPQMEHTIENGEPYFEQRDGVSVLCVPIRLRGQILGAVEFQRSWPGRWSPSAQELVQTVADRLALSLENARLFEQAQTTAQREQVVSRITSQLQATNDLQSLLTLAAAQFQDALGATQTRVRLGLAPARPSDSSVQE